MVKGLKIWREEEEIRTTVLDLHRQPVDQELTGELQEDDADEELAQLLGTTNCDQIWLSFLSPQGFKIEADSPFVSLVAVCDGNSIGNPSAPHVAVPYKQTLLVFPAPAILIVWSVGTKWDVNTKEAIKFQSTLSIPKPILNTISKGLRPATCDEFRQEEVTRCKRLLLNRAGRYLRLIELKAPQAIVESTLDIVLASLQRLAFLAPESFIDFEWFYETVTPSQSRLGWTKEVFSPLLRYFYVATPAASTKH